MEGAEDFPAASPRKPVGVPVESIEPTFDKDFRGLGLLRRLYHETRNRLPLSYQLCVTEIATRNIVSLEAHKKMEFEVASTYHDGNELWDVVVWDLAY